MATEAARLRRDGFDLVHEDGVTCCYGLQHKFWITGTDQRAWEIYTVLADAPRPSCAAPSCAAESAT